MAALPLQEEASTHLGTRSLHYDPTASPHDHFVCRQCGRVEDLMESAPGPVRRAAEHAGHDVTSHTLVLYGRCRACREPR